MITGISLNNFKAFKNISDLSIKPLTIIAGVNSSGKSSILHSLLLLKQTLDEELRYGSLRLEGRYLQYTNLREIAFNLPRAASACILIKLALVSKEGKKRSVNMEFRHKEIPGLTNEKAPLISRFTWQTEDSKSRGSIYLKKGVYYSSSRELTHLRPSHQIRAVGKLSIQFDRFLPQYVVGEFEVREGKTIGSRTKMPINIPIRIFSDSLGDCLEDIREELSNLRYLGPVRAKPQRAYIYYSPHYELDDDGGNAAQVYWLRRNEKVIWRGKPKTLEEAVVDALLVLGLNQRVIPKRSSSIVYQIEVSTTSDPKKRVSIADVGFGYSQSLPIILRGLLAPKNSLVIFEQPEIHLHPSSKANLADLFLGFIQSGCRVIAETHSAELIDRLRLRVIENPDIADRINIVFVEPQIPDTSEGAIIHQLVMNEDGMLDVWPDGFCDESGKLARELIIARASRRK